MTPDENLLFYDIEVFPWDSLIVFKDIDHNLISALWANRERCAAEKNGQPGFMDLPSGFEEIETLIEGKTLVGFNNMNYDDKILRLMANGSRQSILYKTSVAIINGQGDKLKPINHRTLDTMQQIDGKNRPSLKQIEGNMGMSIVESKIPFDYPDLLDDDQRAETFFYCSHDVDATIEIYKLRKLEYFAPKDSLVSRLPESERERANRWNTTTISAKLLLGDKKLTYYRNWSKLGIPPELWRNVEGIPPSVWDMWEQINHVSTLAEMGTKSVEVEDLGVVINFAFGGLHGAPAKPGTYYNVRLLDVGSMYPSIIRILSALGTATETYDNLRKERLSIKHTDKILSRALKLVLNSVYGNLKQEYSALYAPKASVTVCAYGQIAVYELARDLHAAGFQIININTDGVAFVGKGDVSEVVSNWEQKYLGMELEEDKFTKWIQKDVNNYVAVTPDGHVKTKGGDTTKYNEDRFFSTNNCRIIDIAVVEYLVNGTDIVDTLLNNIDKPELFQYVLKAGAFKGVCDENGNHMNKVNRVFARRKTSKLPSTKLYKYREDGAMVNFPDVPDDMFVWNDAIKGMPEPDENIDLSHYHRLAKHALERWGY